jgi:hypothetical protein
LRTVAFCSSTVVTNLEKSTEKIFKLSYFTISNAAKKTTDGKWIPKNPKKMKKRLFF